MVVVRLGGNAELNEVVMSRLNAADAARMACVCRGLRDARRLPCSPQLWLVGILKEAGMREEEEGKDKIWMLDVMSKEERCVQPKLPPGQVLSRSRSLLLCSFRGKLLVRLGNCMQGCQLVLGDPLDTATWQLLPPAPFRVHKAAFCPLDGSLLAISAQETATLAEGGTSWRLDEPTQGLLWGAKLVWVRDAFYTRVAFGDEEYIARYDPRKQRGWCVVKLEFPAGVSHDALGALYKQPAELHGNLLVYLEGCGFYESGSGDEDGVMKEKVEMRNLRVCDDCFQAGTLISKHGHLVWECCDFKCFQSCGSNWMYSDTTKSWAQLPQRLPFKEEPVLMYA